MPKNKTLPRSSHPRPNHLQSLEQSPSLASPIAQPNNKHRNKNNPLKDINKHRKDSENSRNERLLVFHVPYHNEEFDFTSTAKGRKYDPEKLVSTTDDNIKKDINLMRTWELQTNNLPSDTRHCNKTKAVPSLISRSEGNSPHDICKGNSPKEVIRKSSIKNKCSLSGNKTLIAVDKSNNNISISNKTESKNDCSIQGVYRKSPISSETRTRSNSSSSKSSPRVSFQVDKFVIESMDEFYNPKLSHRKLSHQSNVSEEPLRNSSGLIANIRHSQPNLNRSNSDRQLKTISATENLHHRHSISAITPKKRDVQIFNVYNNPCFNPNNHANDDTDEQVNHLFENFQVPHELLINLSNSHFPQKVNSDNQQDTITRNNCSLYKNLDSDGLKDISLSRTKDVFLDSKSSELDSENALSKLHTYFTSSGESSDTLSTISGRTVVRKLPIEQASSSHSNMLNQDIYNEHKTNNVIYSNEINSDVNFLLENYEVIPDSQKKTKINDYLDSDVNCNCNSRLGDRTRLHEKPPLPPKPKKNMSIDLKGHAMKNKHSEEFYPDEQQSNDSNKLTKIGNLIKPPIDFQAPCHDVYCGFIESPLSVRFEEILQNYDKISAGELDTPKSDIKYGDQSDRNSQCSSSESIVTCTYGSRNSVSVPLETHNEGCLTNEEHLKFSSLPMISASKMYSSSNNRSRSTDLINHETTNTYLMSPIVCPLPLCCDQAMSSATDGFLIPTDSYSSGSQRYFDRKVKRIKPNHKSVKNFVNLNHYNYDSKIDSRENCNRRKELKNCNDSSISTPTTEPGKFNAGEICDCQSTAYYKQRPESNYDSTTRRTDFFSPNESKIYENEFLVLKDDERNIYANREMIDNSAVEILDELCPTCDAKYRNLDTDIDVQEQQLSHRDVRHKRKSRQKHRDHHRTTSEKAIATKSNYF